MGPILGAEFLVAAGELRAFGNKVLKRVFYQSAFASLRSSPQSRAFYDRKRAEGKRHTQALIALARRRVNVVWAMLRDGTTFKASSAA
jgi:transposase